MSNFNQSVGGVTRVGDMGADARSNYGTEHRFG